MEQGIRINKYLSEAGICSRRQADNIIEAGEVTVNGERAVLGTRVFADSIVKYKGKTVMPIKKKVIYAYNKPMGLVCTSEEADKDSIFNYADFPEKVNYVGRLDKDSQGLLLLTNDGALANSIQKSVNNHEKEYHVRVNKDITDEFISDMAKGVPILDTVTKKCKVIKTGNRTFKIILTQGLNRQIRRMCEQLGYRVVHLKRVRIVNVVLGNLRPGDFRSLSEDEEKRLRNLCR
ncbi:MAG: pseudouridine synthase [Clostridium sp.]|nr:pseudouridine synthase [Clostridium sp.]MCM1397954.1 pseudouridine synthase [Clostridium sp.]MCM1459409.1 pseudouridine synthase [Bacteroides sp.]